MLVFPLKKEWYEKYKSGEKTVEYREVKPYWTKRLKNAMIDNRGKIELLLLGFACLRPRIPHRCKLRLGYTNKYLTADIEQIEVIDGINTDLQINKFVYAIHLTNIKECE